MSFAIVVRLKLTNEVVVDVGVGVIDVVGGVVVVDVVVVEVVVVDVVVSNMGHEALKKY